MATPRWLWWVTTPLPPDIPLVSLTEIAVWLSVYMYRWKSKKLEKFFTITANNSQGRFRPGLEPPTLLIPMPRSSTTRSSRPQQKRGEAKSANSATPLSPMSAGDFYGISAARRARLEEQLEAAAGAYRRERYGDASRMVRGVLREAPGATAARELLGLALYRQNKWGAALRELQEFSESTGSTEQYPVMADCARAQKHYKQAKEYWDELRRAAPSPELVAEGRMVMAGVYVDQEDLQSAFNLLEPSGKSLRAPKDYHLRQWYVLADVLERMGEHARARRLFERIAQHDAKFSDVSARLRALR